MSYLKRREYFRTMTDEALIEAHNYEVKKAFCWTNSRASYLVALYDELETRNLDWSDFDNKVCRSLATLLKLTGRRVKRRAVQPKGG